MFAEMTSINNTFSEGKVEAPVRQAVMTLLLANAVAVDVELPSSPVDSWVIYYQENHASTVAATVAKLNEKCPVNVPVALRLVQTFYGVRYAMVHQASIGGLDLMVSIAQSRPASATTIPKEMLELIKDVDRGMLENIQNQLVTLLAK